MKKLIKILVLSFPLIASTQESGIAVVELFTSQGCSSCPSADRVLSEIINKSDNNPAIYGLSFHVDYWNYIGWKDPYSKNSFSKRQRKYGEIFSNSTIYTPQMIVNGQSGFVGSDGTKAQEKINEVLKKSPKNMLEISFEKKDGMLIVDYKIEGSLKNIILNVALVERDLVTIVTRGENRNKTLRNDNVVREFKSVTDLEKGQLDLSLPKNYDESKSAIIAYTQDQNTFWVTGATKIDL